MVNGKKLIFSLLLVFLSLVLLACSNQSSTENIDSKQPDKQEEPKDQDDSEEPEVKESFSGEDVTLKIATPWNEDYFMERIGTYVEENYPHMTLEHVNWNGSSEHLQELYADKVIPDVFLAFSGQAPLEDTDSVYPLDYMIEAYGVDLSHIKPSVLDEIRSRDSERRLVGIPQETGVLGLYYNKEVFDVFGIDYPDPEQSMTWDELFDLSERLTGEVNGTIYCGLHYEGDLYKAPLWQHSMTLTDPETGEVKFAQDDRVISWMQLMERMFKDPTQFDGSCSFWEKTTAMMIGWHGFMHQWVGGDTLEEVLEYKKSYDVVPLPVWSDKPGVTVYPRGIHPWAVNNHSDKKEAALEFALIGASEDYQMTLARIGTPSVLNTQESIDQYGADNELYHDKNVKALFANTPADPPEVQSRWDQYVEFDMTEFMESNMDIHEYLRVTAERAQIKIQDAMGQQ